MSKTLCFTGHRPEKLGGYDMWSSKNVTIATRIRTDIIKLIEEDNVSTFICGGALGIDQMAFKIVYGLKKIYPDVRVIVAVPFKNQDNKWILESKREYQRQLNQADEVIYVDTQENYELPIIPIGEYHPAKMQIRNQWMVDNSDIIYAVWNNSKGGTANCVRYAKKKGKSILGFNPDVI